MAIPGSPHFGGELLGVGESGLAEMAIIDGGGSGQLFLEQKSCLTNTVNMPVASFITAVLFFTFGHWAENMLQTPLRWRPDRVCGCQQIRAGGNGHIMAGVEVGDIFFALNDENTCTQTYPRLR